MCKTDRDNTGKTMPPGAPTVPPMGYRCWGRQTELSASLFVNTHRPITFTAILRPVGGDGRGRTIANRVSIREWRTNSADRSHYPAARTTRIHGASLCRGTPVTTILAHIVYGGVRGRFYR